MESNFDTLALEFVKELSEVFPEETAFAVCVENFDSYDPKKFLADTLGDHRALAVSKDEKLLEHVNVHGVDVKALWATTSDVTKESIWAYVSTLVMLASALENTPKELMTGIESLAQEFSEKMQEGTLDMNTLFSDVMMRVQQMDLSSMKDIDINKLTASMGVDPAMISGLMGGVDPSVVQNMMSMMGGADEDDLLKLLETARPPALEEPKKKKKSKKSKYPPGAKNTAKYDKSKRKNNN